MEQTELITILDSLIKANTSNQRNRSNIATDIAKPYIKQTGAAISPKIISELDEHYDKAELLEITKYARIVVKENQALLESLPLNLPYSLLLNSDISTANKARLVWMVAFVFSRPDVYRLFHYTLFPELQQAAEHMTWLPRVSADVLGQLVGTTLAVRTGESSYYGGTVELNKRFLVLPHQGGGWNGNIQLEWPPAIRAFLQTVYPQPADYHIRTVAEPAAGLLRWEEGETIIFDEIQKLLAYQIQDNIAINNSGKVAATSFKRMRKLLGLREFFPNSDAFPLVRTACLAQMLVSIELKKNQINVDSLEALRLLFKAFPKKFSALFLLNDLKNHGYVSFHAYKQQAELTLADWLQRLPVGEWVPIDNILGYSQIHELSTMPCAPGQYMSLVYESGVRLGSVVKHSVSIGNLYSFIEKPTLLGGFYLFAALGWLDIAYQEPTGQFSRDYYSAYDGLKYVRLNALGAYLAGRTREYTPKVNTATQELRFDEQSLLIFCDPENVIAETILANYAERVSPTRFRVTATTFLKDCRTKAQLTSKVTLFCKSIAPNLPPNWLAFFDELTAKAEPLKLAPDMTIYRVPPGNQPLIRLLAQDAVLKTMVVKAEGFRVLVATDQLTRFKNRLRELGYLM